MIPCKNCITFAICNSIMTEMNAVSALALRCSIIDEFTGHLFTTNHGYYDSSKFIEKVEIIRRFHIPRFPVANSYMR